MSKKKPPAYNYRSAKSGRFVKVGHAKRHPNTTVRERR